MSTLAQVEIRADILANIHSRTDALSDAQVRERYLAVTIAFNKMMGLAGQQARQGNPAAAALMQGLLAIQGEQKRLLDEPAAWERMERP
ncbi:hypothetical protein SEA_SPEEDDEMON_830 [Gordonia phage SpeedDemon]|uniref:Uncharacterized protein n=1 Tax=Gordonia phage Bantam TaxID=1887641 RepID=A0A1B3AYF1_9CAUD|nr:hypothetical protein BIZ77_gp097 [Gordonia phage Bantam]AOE43771.1 hypothetical protein SEA_BANTAM_82 [Gordonia phage Bantam]QNL30533.1 hypothetical protein SEA_SPEEDDEMON_830 [Gordonia phage SpeedDemon]